MPAKLLTDDGAHTVIRPLAYCAEKDIARYARAMEFPIIPCNLCGSQQNLQRQHIKSMLHDWEKQYPGRTEIIFQATQNVTPSHLLDNNLFDFKTLSQQINAEDGDTVFDEPVLDQPVIDELKFDELKFDKPVLNEPGLDDPNLNNPELEQPANERRLGNAAVELKHIKS
jgi:tRNA 2-thiocytidine biosynthesis protein TtcA